MHKAQKLSKDHWNLKIWRFYPLHTIKKLKTKNAKEINEILLNLAWRVQFVDVSNIPDWLTR